MRPAAATFIDALRAEAQQTLVPADDPRLENSAWISGDEVLAVPPGRLRPPPRS
jgi:hypothetical protein